ncbi:glycogen debranching N-terminal domain-containing protein [Saccharopolyspora rhizosphaerae]|nr:glycogen debranching N-terminal domain-containing protein [Saccharopolyspora rhizosphaerae]
MPHGKQPALHELTTTLCAPNIALSSPSGQISRGDGTGLYRQDRRSLAHAAFGVGAAELVPVGSAAGTGHTRFQGLVRGHGDTTPDVGLHYVHDRTLTADAMRETWTLHNVSTESVTVTVTLNAATDLARMDQVKGGEQPALLDPSATEAEAAWKLDDCEVRLRLGSAADSVSVTDGDITWSWRVELEAAAARAFSFEVEQHETEQGGFLPKRPEPAVGLPLPEAASLEGDHGRLLRRSLADLDGLQLSDDGTPGTAFLAAGSPWFLTLFGRDSLLAARLLLPLSTDLAASTLRVLAARQGTKHDPDTEEQPGKIPHEQRRVAIDMDGENPLRLPPLYYGTIDATPLWVCLLHDAWRAGMAESEVRELLPALRAALEWVRGPGDADGDGFLEYSGSAGAGLSNQGWKDSGDGVRWADGTIATRPLALCEVQGYAYEAAIGGAAVLAAFGEDASTFREWAADLRERFRASFWLDDEHGRYPAIALDGDKRPVSGPTSNMAHLLGTGLLDAHEAELVAEQLGGPALNSGYGLRTLSAQVRGFNPFSYHCGSIWPHDTAIAVLGLASEGFHEQARALAEGLVHAGPAFDFRLPELFGGTDRGAGDAVSAYPSSCTPQAWAAAGATAVVGYLQGWNDPASER